MPTTIPTPLKSTEQYAVDVTFDANGVPVTATSQKQILDDQSNVLPDGATDTLTISDAAKTAYTNSVETAKSAFAQTQTDAQNALNAALAQAETDLANQLIADNYTDGKLNAPALNSTLGVAPVSPNPAPLSVKTYAAGIGSIGFASALGSDFNVSFPFQPTTVLNPVNATIASLAVEVNFWANGTVKSIESSTQTADHTVTTGANGAGVYELKAQYTLSDGSQFAIGRYVKVDALGNIVADVQLNGASATVNGLSVNLGISVEETGVNYEPKFILLNTAAGSSPQSLVAPPPFELPSVAGTYVILTTVNFDSVFSTDFGGDVFTAFAGFEVA